MAFTLEYVTREPSALVLETIRNEAPHWRESLMPEALRKRGLYRVNVEIHGNRFRLYCPTSSEASTPFYDVHGEVSVDVAGMTRVRARVGTTRMSWAALVPLAILAMWILRSDTKVGIILLVICAAFAAVDFGYDRVAAPGRDAITDHLVARLELAMSKVGATPIERSTSAANRVKSGL